MKISVLWLSVLGFMLTAQLALAHVVVSPKQANVSEFTRFSVGVPVEKDIPTTAVRLVIPEGLEYVTPNVKTGWNITTVKSGDGEEVKITEITWSGGQIPVGQREEFVFNAKVPATEVDLNWKAYQTYSDGSIVSWDQDQGDRPYSTTKIVNDLGERDSKELQSHTTPRSRENALWVISIAALGLAAYSVLKRS